MPNICVKTVKCPANGTHLIFARITRNKNYYKDWQILEVFGIYLKLRRYNREENTDISYTQFLKIYLKKSDKYASIYPKGIPYNFSKNLRYLP